jgi:hypothetical protein
VLILSIKIDFKVLQLLNGWDRVKGFSKGYTLPYIIDLGSFLGSNKSQIFLAMRGAAAPFTPPPQTEGAHPPSGNPLIHVSFE